MLKNIELFDKLSLRFNGRVLFIKDVIGDEICCWSFYGQGRKIAEVCCTSIVYATEKKQTKVGARAASSPRSTLSSERKAGAHSHGHSGPLPWDSSPHPHLCSRSPWLQTPPGFGGGGHSCLLSAP